MNREFEVGDRVKYVAGVPTEFDADLTGLYFNYLGLEGTIIEIEPDFTFPYNVEFADSRVLVLCEVEMQHVDSYDYMI